MALYHAGLSLRKARDLLRSLGYAVSHKGLEGLRLGAFMAAIGRRAREAFWPMKKVRGGQAYVWAARDLASREVVAVVVSWSSRSSQPSSSSGGSPVGAPTGPSSSWIKGHGIRRPSKGMAIRTGRRGSGCAMQSSHGSAS